MGGKVKVSGTWRDMSSAKVKIAGTWRSIDSAYTKIGGAWKQWYSAFTPISATGGTIQNFNVGGVPHRIHTFTSSGTFSVSNPGSGAKVKLLIVGGGGPGGSAMTWPVSGGGGGGGLVINTVSSISQTNYTITVATRTNPAPENSVNYNGASSSALGFTAPGGGGGGQLGNPNGKNGASGGGGRGYSGGGGTGGTGTNPGYSGGNGGANGGGAGGGYISSGQSIAGNNTEVYGGGGYGDMEYTGMNYGNGGSGYGYQMERAYKPEAPNNTGIGGVGTPAYNYYYGGDGLGGSGASGIVIIAYPTDRNLQ